MKKLVLLFVPLIVLFSCSKQDNPSPPIVQSPTILSTSVTEIQQRTAKFSMTTSDFNYRYHKRGFVYSDTPNPSLENGKKTEGSTLDRGQETTSSASLICDKTYYLRAYCTDQDGVTSYGQEVVFTTLKPGTDIKRIVDEFTNDITLMSPTISIVDDGTLGQMVYLFKKYGNYNYFPKDTDFVVFKMITPENYTLYALHVSNVHHTSYYYKKGAYLLFEDDTQLKFPEVDIKCEFLKWQNETYTSHFLFSTIIFLNESDLDMLETKSIKKVRLYLIDSDVGIDQAINLRKYIKAIRAMN